LIGPTGLKIHATRMHHRVGARCTSSDRLDGGVHQAGNNAHCARASVLNRGAAAFVVVQVAARMAQTLRTAISQFHPVIT
jgi:hypothetical protein